MKKLSSRVIGGVLAVLLVGSAWAEDCTITEDRDAGVIVIRTAAGRDYRALTDEGKRKIIQQAVDLKAANTELQQAKAELEELKKQVAAYEQLHKGGDSLIAKQKEYIGDLEQSLGGYRALADDYRKLTRGPGTLTLEVGIGATGGDTKPALLVGAGIRRLRVWGFFQENNSGALVGIQYPIF